MTPRVSVLPAADRDIDGQAEYLMREASLKTALRFYDATAATFDKLARRAGEHRPKGGPPSQDHLVSPDRRRGASLCDRNRRERLLLDAHLIGPDSCDQGDPAICLALRTSSTNSLR